MNKPIISLIIIITAFTKVQAQDPRVCDYVSLKYALKGREYEVITAEPAYNGVELLHTKKEIRIPTIGQFGKEIDSLDIIDYNGDTVYIYRKVRLDWDKEIFREIKSKKGAYRIYKDGKNISFEHFEIEDNDEGEFNSDPNYLPSIYPDLFKWDGLEKLLKDRDMALIGEEFEELTRLIFENYKLVHVDKWFFRPWGFSHKRLHEIYKRSGIKTNLALEIELVHIYDTINKKDNDEYISIMFEDENIPPNWFKKGTWAIEISGKEKKQKYFIYKEPDTESQKVYKFKEGVLIVYDIIGYWYYVKVIDQKEKEHYGWIKIDKDTFNPLNAEFYKHRLPHWYNRPK